MMLETPASVLATSAWNHPARIASWVGRLKSAAPDCAEAGLVLGSGMVPKVLTGVVGIVAGVVVVVVAGIEVVARAAAGAAAPPRRDDDAPHPARIRTVIAAIGANLRTSRYRPGSPNSERPPRISQHRDNAPTLFDNCLASPRIPANFERRSRCPRTWIPIWRHQATGMVAVQIEMSDMVEAAFQLIAAARRLGVSPHEAALLVIDRQLRVR